MPWHWLVFLNLKRLIIYRISWPHFGFRWFLLAQGSFTWTNQGKSTVLYWYSLHVVINIANLKIISLFWYTFIFFILKINNESISLKQPGSLVVKMLVCCAGSHTVSIPSWRTQNFPETYISKMPTGCHLGETLDWQSLIPVSMLNEWKNHIWGRWGLIFPYLPLT